MYFHSTAVVSLETDVATVGAGGLSARAAADVDAAVAEAVVAAAVAAVVAAAAGAWEVISWALAVFVVTVVRALISELRCASKF